MARVILSIHFDEDIQMTPDDAEAVVIGVFERNGIDSLSLVQEDGFPRAYDVQDNQVDAMVEVSEADDPVQHARQVLNRKLANGSGAPVHRIQGHLKTSA